MEAIFNTVVGIILLVGIPCIIGKLWALIRGPYTLREQAAMAGYQQPQRMSDYFVGSERAQAASKRESDLYYEYQSRF